MSKVDLKVFEELLKESEGEADCLDNLIYFLADGEFGDGCVSYPGNYETYKANCALKEKEWEYEHLEQEGGGEGGSEYCYGVFKLRDKIYRAEYSYYSHNGYEYDDITNTLTEVKPVEKTITVYEPV